MGCSVIWGYWELFGKERISRTILIDQMPMISVNPIWSEQASVSAPFRSRQDRQAVLDCVPKEPRK